MRRPPLSTASISPRAAMKFGLMRTNRDGDDDGRVPRSPAGAIGADDQNDPRFQAGGRPSRVGGAGPARQMHRNSIDQPNGRKFPAQGRGDRHWLTKYATAKPAGPGRTKVGPILGYDKAGDYGGNDDRHIFDSVMKGR